MLIRAHGAASSPAWGEISSLLGRMKHTWGIPPSTTTYNALLEICAVTNDYERGCEVRSGASEQRCSDSAHCAFSDVRVRSALCAQLIDRMLEEGVEPDGFTVAAVSSRKSLRSYLKRGL